jgi:aldehyde dehydrogenase (NAD+)
MSSVCGGGRWLRAHGPYVEIRSPIDRRFLARLGCANRADYDEVITLAASTMARWRSTPAPQRGEVVRRIGEALRREKESLAEVIAWSVGKPLSEARGEVQEAIDIADFAVGLSRQLCGRTMFSERPSHRMYEQWHPLGIVGVITAFNFPVAVWAWNAFIAAVCGNVVVWKPSEKAMLPAVALTELCNKVFSAKELQGVFSLIATDGKEAGEWLAADSRISLVSATGSTSMGHKVSRAVSDRFGKVLLELGGNNGAIIMPSASRQLALRAVTFGVAGTSGQRCTTTRRIFLHRDVYEEIVDKLKAIFASIHIGNPLEDGVLMGPLIEKGAVVQYEEAIKEAVTQGGEVLCGGEVLTSLLSGLYVQPTLIAMPEQTPLVHRETFAPIAYVIKFDSLEEAIALNNQAPQGLSSSLFTNDLQEAELFLSERGSDCGIANVNLGTSGAEIGGAFGGEKESGGGRLAGSDSWKAYMRRQTNTINFGSALPLAQGVTFEVNEAS